MIHSALPALLLCAAIAAHAAPARPNLVFILTDNHGAWTLGCYGNQEIQTPSIDRLAAEGILFTRAFCNNSVCSPSRATFLTGLVPSQHGVHSYLGGEKPDAQNGPDAYCTIREFASLPKILSQAGYTCGLAGKWHLGDSLRPQEGFTAWYTKPRGHTTTFINADVIEHGKTFKEPKYLTEAITDRALEFLDASHRKPFFLYVAYNGPYGLGANTLKNHTNRHAAYYADKEMKSFPRHETSPWLMANRDCMNDVDAMRGYAAAVSGVDDGVGRLLDKLEQLGLNENTLVVFAGDQGLSAGHGGFWGMGDHARPIHTREATIRIPLIFRHTGRIPARIQSDLMVCNYDFLPTVLDHLGFADQTPSQPALPGRNFAPVLAGKTIPWENVIFHEYENTRMIRTESWKLTVRHPYGPDELYHLGSDPEEGNNLIHVRQHRPIRLALKKDLDQFFATYVDPQYDLWRDGQSKAGRVLRTP